MQFPKACRPWPGDGLRRASVNSSGFGGANAHAVLEDAYHYLQEHGLEGNHCTVPNPTASFEHSTAINGVLPTTSYVEKLSFSTPQLFVWSAADSGALKRLLASYKTYLADVFDHQEPAVGYLESLAHTLAKRRSLFPWRSYAVADSLQSLIEAISSVPATIKAHTHPKIGFVFTGQGAQWLGMGKELLMYDVFRHSVKHAEIYLRGLGCSWSLIGQ